MDTTQGQVGKNTLKDQIALLSFIEDMLKEANDTSIKPEALPAIKETLLTKLNEDINTHMINLLSEAGQKELDALLDKNATDDEISNFFYAKIPNFETEMAAVMLSFKGAYLYKPAENASLSTEEEIMPAPPLPL